VAVHRVPHAVADRGTARAARGAVSFWLIAPYIAGQSVADHQAEGTLIGIVLTAVALA
jgi:hypothetical protein